MFQEFLASKRSLSKRKLICDIGINDAKYQVAKIINGKKYVCPFYFKWSAMIRRCYSAKIQEKFPTYIGCTVCDEWHLFSNFKLWMIKQDWQGNQLDKDILIQGNKIYSPDFCLFVSRQVNILLTDSKATRGKHPQGVCFNVEKGRFQAQLRINGKTKYLGRFDTPEEAQKTYMKAKYKNIKEIALQQQEPIKSALLNYKLT